MVAKLELGVALHHLGTLTAKVSDGEFDEIAVPELVERVVMCARLCLCLCVCVCVWAVVTIGLEDTVDGAERARPSDASAMERRGEKR